LAQIDTAEVGVWVDTVEVEARVDTVEVEAWVDTVEAGARADTAVEADPRTVMGELAADMAVQSVAAELLLHTRQREIEIRMWYPLPGLWYFRQK
jgi:hypothetical protein